MSRVLFQVAPVARTFFVPGKCQTRGSKKGIVVYPKGKKPRAIVVDDNTKSGPWMLVVSGAARELGVDPLDGPVQLECVFRMLRPRKHFRTGRYSHLLRDDTKADHIVRPDLGKLMRPIEDALSGILYHDDSQIVSWGDSTKLWVTERPGVEITVSEKR